MGIGPMRLNHAVLFVADLARSERFYTEVFSMDVVLREPRANAVFLRLPRSVHDHDLGLMGVGRSAPPRRHGGIGLYHLAWQVDTVDELPQVRKVLAEAGAYTGSPATAARPRASTAPTPTATSSRSCGCSLATSGARTRPPRPSNAWTWQKRSAAGAVYAPPARSAEPRTAITGKQPGATP